MNPQDEARYRQYRQLLGQYRDPPRGAADKKVLDHDLARAEHNLVANPPMYRNDNGVWVPRAKGLITPDEARANAEPDALRDLETLEMPRAPRVRDDFKLIPEREWGDVLQQKRQDEAMNRPFVKFILDQNGHGSCASAGYAGCVMFLQGQQGSVAEKLNELGLYGLVNGGRDGGSSLSDNISAGAKYGVPSERVWPRSHGWRKKLSDEARQDALRNRLDEYWRVGSKIELGTAILLGMPVYAGYSGHAWFAVDLLDSDRFVWANSWGASWSDGGFGTLRFRSVAWHYGLWCARSCVRPTPLANAV